MRECTNPVRVTLTTPSRDDMLKMYVDCEDDSLVVALHQCLKAVSPPRMFELLAQLAHYAALLEGTSGIHDIDQYEQEFCNAAQEVVDAWHLHDRDMGRERERGGLI